MKNDILLREQRLEERIRQFEESSKQQHLREHHEEPLSSQHPYARSPHNSSGLKRKSNDSLHQTPPPKPA